MPKYTTYRKRNVLHTGNGIMDIYISPEAGGRILQLALDGYEYLYVNPKDEEDPSKWNNIGGEKIWPAPQGWEGGDQWPGPSGSVLDSGEYCYSEISDEIYGTGLRLTSPADEYTGIVSSRDIFPGSDTSILNINATFTNKSDKARNWSIWPVCQVDMLQDQAYKEDRFKIICPLSKKNEAATGY